MPRPNVKDWEGAEALLNASVNGFNILIELPKLLKKNTDWGSQFEFAFISEDDLAYARSIGWKHVLAEHFDTGSFNDNVGLRFGLTDEGGKVMSKKNYLMMMPAEWRQKQMASRHKYHEDMIAKTLEAKSYASPEDPEYAKMLKASADLSEGETAIVMARSESQEPIVPARPLKEK